MWKGRNTRTAAFTYDHLHRQQGHRSQCDCGDTQLQSLKKKIFRGHFHQAQNFILTHILWQILLLLKVKYLGRWVDPGVPCQVMHLAGWKNWVSEKSETNWWWGWYWWVTLAWIMFVEESPGGCFTQGPSRAQVAIFKKCCQGAQLARALPRVGAEVPERIW